MDFLLNLTGNLGSKAKADSVSVETLTSALRAQEKQLRALNANPKKGPGSAVNKLAISQSKAAIAEFKAELKDLSRADTGKGFFDTIAKSRGPIGGLVRDAQAIGKAFADNKAAAFAVGVAAVSVAVLSLTVALGRAGVEAGLFALKAADAGRNVRILNQAADIAGGTHSQLGAIVKQVAEGPTTLSKERIGELAREMRTLRFDSRQTQLAVTAMATAESALGSGASSAIRGIADQSREARRFVLGARDLHGEYQALKGTGLGKRDVFGALAKNLGISIGAAEQKFRNGRVSIREGLEAIEKATRTKFGGVVEAQLLSLDNQFGRAKEDIASLFAGVNIDPFLRGLKKITGIFSDSTAGGRALRVSITAALDDLAAKAATVFPYVESFLYGFGTGALDVYTDSIKPLLDSLSAKVEGGGLEGSFNAGETAARGLATTLKEVLATVIKIGNAAETAGHFISIVTSPIETARKDNEKAAQEAEDAAVARYTTTSPTFFKGGTQVANGASDGVRAGTPGYVKAVTDMAVAGSDAFSHANQMHSPSRLYEKRAEYIPMGAERGVRKGTPGLQEAISDMAAPPSPAAGGAGGGPMTATATIVVNLDSSIIWRGVQKMAFEAASGGPRAGIR